MDGILFPPCEVNTIDHPQTQPTQLLRHSAKMLGWDSQRSSSVLTDSVERNDEQQPQDFRKPDLPSSHHDLVKVPHQNLVCPRGRGERTTNKEVLHCVEMFISF